MQPHSRSIFDLFDGKKRYVVPLFQRQYVWNLEEQWQPLWEDIERKFVERLLGKDGPPHFLGAMVLDQRRVYGNAVTTHLVIDGQQRLTTFQIFLSAFRDVCFEQAQPGFGEECQRYLVNTGIMADTKVEQYKVWPTSLDLIHINPGQTAKARLLMDELPDDLPVFKCPMVGLTVKKQAKVEMNAFLRALLQLTSPSLGNLIASMEHRQD